LIERIEKLDNPAVINNVAEALGKIKPITAIPDLSNLLEHQNPYIRGTAAKILGEIRSKDAIPALLKAVENNSEDFSIHEILIALGKIGSEDAVPTLLEKMTSPYSEIRANAATALGEIGSEDAISVLLKAIENEEEEFAAERILTALGKIGSEDAIPTLLEKIKSPSSGVRANAARALGKIGSKDTIPTLLKALKDDYFIRKKVALAFSEFQGDRAAHILPDLLALIPTNSSKEAFRALQFIQSNCNFYSYEIWQSDTQESTELMSERNPSIDHVISNIDKNVQVIAQHTQATAENIEEITQSAQATAQNTQVATQHTQATAENTQLAAQNMRKIARDKMPLIAIIVALFIMFITMNVSGAHNQEFRDLVKWLMHQVIRQEVTKPVDSLLTGGKNLKDATLLLKEWANLINLRTSNISPGKYELSLISLTNTDQIPGEGQDLVFVAKIGESYHIRIFDEAGKIIFGHENSEFSPEQELKEELEAIFQGSNPNTLIAIDDEAKAKFISIITSTLKRAQQSQ
ncbi:MAG: HEAT repeat domain-containing protein, partial [Cyanobacteria bacterium P01_F01_bin.116]